MMENTSALKITLEINQDTNLDELMAHLYLMQNAIPDVNAANEALLPDFSVHEGELELFGSGPADS
jgi:hypothetical protein